MDNLKNGEWLLSTRAVRGRCNDVFEYVTAGRSRYFALHVERLPDCAATVIEVMNRNYPRYNIPYHSRWRHFEIGGVDRWNAWCVGVLDREPLDRIRAAIDLVVVSVLLDAGAGTRWRYHELSTNTAYSRSEGLAVASFNLFTQGGFSSDPHCLAQADADGLAIFDEQHLVNGFQVTPANPLDGITGRVQLLNRLGAALRRNLPDDSNPRVADLFNAILSASPQRALAAHDILSILLYTLGDIWPQRRCIDGVIVGDVGRHPAADDTSPTRGWVPFHKLSQWLAYSLIEPFEWAGFAVEGVDALTGLAEYRNGGLFIDTGVLTVHDERLLREPLAPDSRPVVEWRALTVTLLDRLADEIRTCSGMDETELPLARILEGGTWSAGREVAVQRRADGSPPIRLLSDGTVF